MLTPSAVGYNKVIIDGYFLGESDRGDIKGMFRDSEGRALLQFGRDVKMDLAIHEEVLALQEGLLVEATSRWVSTHSFVFESDCKSIVAWTADRMSAPWRFHMVFCECCYVFGVGIS